MMVEEHSRLLGAPKEAFRLLTGDQQDIALPATVWLIDQDGLHEVVCVARTDCTAVLLRWQTVLYAPQTDVFLRRINAIEALRDRLRATIDLLMLRLDGLK